MADLTILILTFNEEKHIGRALESVAPIARRVVIIDSGSTDRTVEIAKQFGAVVLTNPFVNHAQQFQWGLERAGVDTKWLMRLDADEIIEPDLQQEIERELPKLGDDVAGVNLKRKHIFLGRWIRHGGRYPLILLRICRTGQGRVEDRWMDEHMIVWGGRVVTFNGGFADHNLGDLTYFTTKHNRYATLEAIEILNRKLGLFVRVEEHEDVGGSRQAAIKRFVKEKIYNKIPFQISTLAYFLYRYFLQLGFLDGRPGVIYHGLQGFWYRFLVGAKVVELEMAIAHLKEPDAIRAELSRLTGHKL